MREILFRAKAINRDCGYHRTDYKNGDWVYGLITRPYNEMYEVPMQMANTDGVEGIEVDYKTLGQFTGLTDKNGKKIFEGDIVRLEDYWDRGKVFIVKYTDDKVGSCGCCFPEFGGIGFVMESKDGKRVCYDKDVIVIGNVTDNSELLESE